MKSHSGGTILLTVIVLFWLLTAKSIAAQVLEMVNEHYLIEADYDKEQAFAGNKNLKLKVTNEDSGECNGAELHNEYLDYTVNVHKIRVIPVPAGLITKVDLAPLDEVKPEIDPRTQTISFKPFLSIKPGRKEPIPLEWV